MMLKKLVIFILLFGGACSLKALFCPPNGATTLLMLPTNFTCPPLKNETKTAPVKISLNVYRLPFFEVNTIGYHCQCYKLKAKRDNGFRSYGAIEYQPPIKIEISAADCVFMVENHYSNVVRSTMVKKENLFVTTNELKWKRANRLFVWTLESSVDNCFYSEASIRRHNNVAVSNTPIASNCTYEQGNCIAEQGFVVWNTTKAGLCDYQFVISHQGQFDGSTFVSDNSLFSLTFNIVDGHYNETFSECGSNFILSEQGDAVLESELVFARKKRALSHLVPVEEHNAALQAVIYRFENMFMNGFISLYHNHCSVSSMLLQIALSLSSSDPNQLIRLLLNDSSVTATTVAPGILEAKSCYTVNVEYQLENRCFNKLPVVIEHLHGTEKAFLNPLSGILELDADYVPCTTKGIIYIREETALLSFDQVTGVVSSFALPPQIMLTSDISSSTEFLRNQNYRVKKSEYPTAHNFFSQSYKQEVKSTSYSISKLNDILSGNAMDENDLKYGLELAKNMGPGAFSWDNILTYVTGLATFLTAILPYIPHPAAVAVKWILVVPKIIQFFKFMQEKRNGASRIPTAPSEEDEAETGGPGDGDIFMGDLDKEKSGSSRGGRRKRQTEYQGRPALTGQLNETALDYTSRIHPGTMYTFIRKRENKSKKDAYYCSSCRAAKRQGHSGQIRTLYVEDKIYFTTDPDLFPHICEGYRLNETQTTARNIIRQANTSQRINPLPASLAISNLTERITTQHPQNFIDIARALPSQDARRKNADYHAKKSTAISVTNFFIPEELKLSSVPRPDNIPNFIVRFLRPGPVFPFLFMIDYHLLSIFRQARHIVIDGTFQYSPTEFKQIYTFTAVFSDLPDRSAGYLIGIGILPDKHTNTYLQLFNLLRGEVESEFGDIGQPKIFHLDCESAAINAVERVFPESRVKLCLFHFAKNLYDYNHTNDAVELNQHPDFLHLKNSLIGSLHLPIELHQQFWAQSLSIHNLPRLPLHLEPKLVEFVNYFQRWWTPRIDYLNFNLNDGPRTSNNAEGLHNKFNVIFGGNTNVSFTDVFLKLKKLLATTLLEWFQRNEGRILPLRAPVDRIRERKIIGIRQRMDIHYGNGNELSFEELKLVCRYLSHISSPQFNVVRDIQEEDFLDQLPFLQGYYNNPPPSFDEPNGDQQQMSGNIYPRLDEIGEQQRASGNIYPRFDGLEENDFGNHIDPQMNQQHYNDHEYREEDNFMYDNFGSNQHQVQQGHPSFQSPTNETSFDAYQAPTTPRRVSFQSPTNEGEDYNLTVLSPPRSSFNDQIGRYLPTAYQNNPFHEPPTLSQIHASQNVNPPLNTTSFNRQGQQIASQMPPFQQTHWPTQTTINRIRAPPTTMPFLPDQRFPQPNATQNFLPRSVPPPAPQFSQNSVTQGIGYQPTSREFPLRSTATQPRPSTPVAPRATTPVLRRSSSHSTLINHPSNSTGIQQNNNISRPHSMAPSRSFQLPTTRTSLRLQKTKATKGPYTRFSPGTSAAATKKKPRK